MSGCYRQGVTRIMYHEHRFRTPIVTRDARPDRLVRAAIYVRISSDRSGAGLGVARQEEDCRALCERLGWTAVLVYCDNDVSAYSGKPRPQWNQLQADIAAGLIDAVACWHVDRLTRSPRELEEVIDLHDKRGVMLATVTGGNGPVHPDRPDAGPDARRRRPARSRAQGRAAAPRRHPESPGRQAPPLRHPGLRLPARRNHDHPRRSRDHPGKQKPGHWPGSRCAASPAT